MNFQSELCHLIQYTPRITEYDHVTTMVQPAMSQQWSDHGKNYLVTASVELP